MITGEDAVSVDTGPAPGEALRAEHVAVDQPLAWPIVDEWGTLLFERGAIIPGEEARAFLFRHFEPRRGGAASVASVAPASGEASAPAFRVEDIGLTIGARLGMRPKVGMGPDMHPCRMIGMTRAHELFTTMPTVGKEPLVPNLGEDVEIVAVSSQSVFWFVCSVEAICRSPFDYVILSAPGNIRKLRGRQAVRVRTRLAVRYGFDLAGQQFDGLGLGSDLSMRGISIALPAAHGTIGERVCVAFRLQTSDVGTDVRAVGTIRNIHPDPGGSGLTIHGIEFDTLEASQQLALTAYVLDRQYAPREGGGTSTGT